MGSPACLNAWPWPEVGGGRGRAAVSDHQTRIKKRRATPEPLAHLFAPPSGHGALSRHSTIKSFRSSSPHQAFLSAVPPHLQLCEIELGARIGQEGFPRRLVMRPPAMRIFHTRGSARRPARPRDPIAVTRIMRPPKFSSDGVDCILFLGVRDGQDVPALLQKKTRVKKRKIRKWILGSFEERGEWKGYRGHREGSGRQAGVKAGRDWCCWKEPRSE